MFKNILLPVDGSELSHEAALAGIDWARQSGAQVIGLFVGGAFALPGAYAEAMPLMYPSKREYENAVRSEARGILGRVAEAAAAASVTCVTHVVFASSPAKAIALAARRHGCDLIVMGARGRSGMEQVLLGSFTSKVLATCQVPVLVYRQRGRTSARCLHVRHASRSRAAVAD